MCNFHTWIAIYTTLSCDFMPLTSSYHMHSTSGGNYLAIIHCSTDGKSVCTMQEVALAPIDMHAHDSLFNILQLKWYTM